MSRQTPEATKLYRDLNKDRIKDYLSRYGQRPEIKELRRYKYRYKIIDVLFSAAKFRAKRKNIDFNIDKSDIIVPEVCPIAHIPLYVNNGKSGPNSPTLDRIKNSLGYVKGNVRVISKRANTHKGNMSFEEIERMYLYAKQEI